VSSSFTDLLFHENQKALSKIPAGNPFQTSIENAPKSKTTGTAYFTGFGPDRGCSELYIILSTVCSKKRLTKLHL
jgi:hypothetical protein